MTYDHSKILNISSNRFVAFIKDYELVNEVLSRKPIYQYLHISIALKKFKLGLLLMLGFAELIKETIK